MVYYTSEIAKHVEIIKAESSISLHFETQVNGGPKAQRNANPVNDIQTKITARTSTHILLKPKDDRTYGERVDDRLEADTGERSIRKDAVKMVQKQRYNLGAISPRRAKKCKSRR